jgi:hypothetical protein
LNIDLELEKGKVARWKQEYYMGLVDDLRNGEADVFYCG